MVNITHKSSTLRQAIAEAVVTVSRPETIEAVRLRQVPKGDIFEFSRAAGLLAVKKTADVIPDCHPLPLEYCAISHRIDGLSIIVTVEAHTIYKTGVEVEAMHGAAVTALTMYDMLKPIDTGVEISNIRLVQKKGGKRDAKQHHTQDLLTAVVVCSDSVFAKTAEDKSGATVQQKLEGWGLPVAHLSVVPDEIAAIQTVLKQLQQQLFRLVVLTGGTGVSPRDVTPEAVQPLLDREIPGLMETARNYGQQRMPYAMLSRGVAGFMGEMLVLTLPGSVSGAAETLDALFPQVLHAFKIRSGMRHDDK